MLDTNYKPEAKDNTDPARATIMEALQRASVMNVEYEEVIAGIRKAITPEKANSTQLRIVELVCAGIISLRGVIRTYWKYIDTAIVEGSTALAETAGKYFNDRVNGEIGRIMAMVVAIIDVKEVAADLSVYDRMTESMLKIHSSLNDRIEDCYTEVKLSGK